MLGLCAADSVEGKPWLGEVKLGGKKCPGLGWVHEKVRSWHLSLVIALVL